MKKWIIIISVLIVLLVAAFGAWKLLLMPYRLYFKVLSGEMTHEYLTLDMGKKESAKFLKPSNYYSFHFNDPEIRKTFWAEFRLQNISILMPSRHPYLRPQPYLVTRLGGRRLRRTLFGFKVVKAIDDKFKEYLKYEAVGQKSFSLRLNDQKFFKLPIIKKYILSKGETQIWQDMFTRDLSLNSEVEFDVNSLALYMKYSLQELAYNAYLLHLRRYYFPKRSYGFEFNKKNGAGRILIGQTKSFIKEVYYKLNSGRINIFGLSSRKNDESVAFFRDDFFNRIETKDFSFEDKTNTYLNFKNLSRDEQLSSKGYCNLYSDFTMLNRGEEEDFLKKMIQFIERDPDSYYFLEPLYKYALVRYKRTFSLSSQFVVPDEMLKLRRNIDIELEEEAQKLREQKLVEAAKEFETDDEQVDYYLEVGKDDFEDIEDEMSL